jgi:CRP-like cAMP-binding protein
VVRFSRWEDVGADTILMKDGEPGDYFCFLLYGEAYVSKKGRTLSVLSPGDCFGEMAIVGGGASKLRGADVVCRTLSRIMTIRSEALRHASDTCRMHFYQSFLEVLSSRLSAANIRLATL